MHWPITLNPKSEIIVGATEPSKKDEGSTWYLILRLVPAKTTILSPVYISQGLAARRRAIIFILCKHLWSNEVSTLSICKTFTIQPYHICNLPFAIFRVICPILIEFHMFWTECDKRRKLLVNHWLDKWEQNVKKIQDIR